MQDMEGGLIDEVGDGELSIGDGDCILIINDCINTLFLASKVNGEGFPLYTGESIVLRIPKGSVLKYNGLTDATQLEFRYFIMPIGDIEFTPFPQIFP